MSTSSSANSAANAAAATNLDDDLRLDESQTRTYAATRRVLDSTSAELAQFFGPLASVVAVPEASSVVAIGMLQEGGGAAAAATSPTLPLTPEAVAASLPLTIVSPNGGHRALQHVLQVLEGLEKKEALLVTESPLSRHLTALVTGALNKDDVSSPYTSSAQALEELHRAGAAVPRRVCQHPFRKNDIVWVCRTCQADETCVLCHDCFSQSTHDGHDVAFYHAQAGGCCDCGDPDGTCVVIVVLIFDWLGAWLCDLRWHVPASLTGKTLFGSPLSLTLYSFYVCLFDRIDSLLVSGCFFVNIYCT
jgi:hypothetical protein